MWKSVLAGLLALCACVLLQSQDLQWQSGSEDARAPRKELSLLSSSIRDNLMKLRQESAIMSEELTRLRNELTISENERKALEEQSRKLSDSLTNINRQLNSSYETITRYEMQLRHKKKVLGALAAALLVMIAGKLAGYWLYAKGIRVPRWLDILL